MSDSSPGIFNRALRQFRNAWRANDQSYTRLKDDISPDLPEKDAQLLRKQIDDCLQARGGEVSARSRAAALGETYLVLNTSGRRRFLEILAQDYDVDPNAVTVAVGEYENAPDDAKKRRAQATLRDALIAPRVRLLSQFNGLRQGVKFLVDLRSDLRRFSAEEPALQSLDADILQLLSSWFDIGFLDLKRITWNTPAALLEKLFEYEAVHAIASWEDLKNRLEADHRCYAFFHPHMPDEPLIVVQVALSKGMIDNIHEVLDTDQTLVDPASADNALFYSISNCQSGLAGVGFGNFLIKRVVDDLARDLPNLETFATLSPIPGFCSWLEGHLTRGSDRILPAAELRRLADQVVGQAKGDNADDELNITSRILLDTLANPGWLEDAKLVAIMKPMLMRLCAHYLCKARRKGRALDRVANFHLSNGARIKRINWHADTSARGLKQSAGMMVNYLYALDRIERNHEQYTTDGTISASSAVTRLLKD